MNTFLRAIFLLSLGSLLFACSATKPVTDGNFTKSKTPVEQVIAKVPDYSESLQSLSGKGRAVVSEPGNSDRVTINFESDEDISLLTIQNRIGIEGGQLLVDRDSILIYNRVDKQAQKLSVFEARMTNLNELASINILDLMNFKIPDADVSQVLESDRSYQLLYRGGSQIYVNKEEGWVEQVVRPTNVQAPYSKIIYENYGELEGFLFPRKITIFSADERSRVVFVVQSLRINPDNLNLNIDIPENIVIKRY